MKLYSIKDAARELNIHPSTVWLRIREGQITPLKLGRMWIITEEELALIALKKRGRPRGPGRPLKPEIYRKIDEMQRLRDERLSLREISKRLHISHETVRTILSYLHQKTKERPLRCHRGAA